MKLITKTFYEIEVENMLNYFFTHKTSTSQQRAEIIKMSILDKLELCLLQLNTRTNTKRL